MAWSADRFQKLGEGGSVQVAKERMVFWDVFFLVFLLSVFQELTWVKGSKMQTN